MEHSGSAAAALLKARSDSSNQKECKSATARLKSALAAGAQEISKETVPNRSGGDILLMSSWPWATALFKLSKTIGTIAIRPRIRTRAIVLLSMQSRRGGPYAGRTSGRFTIAGYLSQSYPVQAR